MIAPDDFSVAGEEDPGAALDLVTPPRPQDMPDAVHVPIAVRAADRVATNMADFDQPEKKQTTLAATTRAAQCASERQSESDNSANSFSTQNSSIPHLESALMNAIVNKLSPNATNMIRLDHTHVMATFHQYKTSTRPSVKQGLVNTTCLALEVHAQLEEEIFYPALRAFTDNEVLKKSVPEHDEMRRLISELRSMQPDDPRYDDTYFELMRDVIHHVADEETVVLPEAERVMRDRLGSLGAEMTKRRFQLVAPHTGEITVNMAKAMPGATVAVLGSLLVAAAYFGLRDNRAPYRSYSVY